MRHTIYLVAVVAAGVAVAAVASCPAARASPAATRCPAAASPGRPRRRVGRGRSRTRAATTPRSDAGAKLKAFLQATKDLQKQTAGDRRGRQAELHHDGQRARHVRRRLQAARPRTSARRSIDAYKDNMKVAVKGKARSSRSSTSRPSARSTSRRRESPRSAKARRRPTSARPARAPATASATAVLGQGRHGGSGGECNGSAGAPATATAKATRREGVGQCKASAQGTRRPRCSARAELDVSSTRSSSSTSPRPSRRSRRCRTACRSSSRSRRASSRSGGGRGVGADGRRSSRTMGPKFVNSFKDQAMCITGQIAAAVERGDRHPGERLGLGLRSRRRPAARSAAGARELRPLASAVRALV